MATVSYQTCLLVAVWSCVFIISSLFNIPVGTKKSFFYSSHTLNESMTKCSEDLSPSSTTVTTQITPQLSAFVPFFRHKRIDKKKSIITKRQSQVTDGRGAESCLIRTKWMCGVFSSGSISPSRLLSSQPSQEHSIGRKAPPASFTCF